MSTEIFEVIIRVEPTDEFFTARANFYKRCKTPSGDDNEIRMEIGMSGSNPSRDRASAISYALAELSAMVGKGLIKVP